MAGRTSIVVAHRLRTARRADRVLVMEGGRVVEDGTYEDLAGQDGPFAELISTWESSETRCKRLPPSAEGAAVERLRMAVHRDHLPADVPTRGAGHVEHQVRHLLRRD